MRISILKKLLIIILFPLVFDIVEIALFDFTANTFSAIRAHVNGESLWSKAQKDALSALQRYTQSRDEADFEEYLRFLEVPLGDRAARLSLEKNPPDIEAAESYFIQGRNHPDDVRAMALFYIRFRNAPYVRDAFKAWPEADDKLIELQWLADNIHESIGRGATEEELEPLSDALQTLNLEITRLEDEFSRSLGRASRIAKNVLITSVLSTSILFFFLSVMVPLYLGRNIVRSIQKLKTAAGEYEAGQLKKIELEGNDELTDLALTLSNMAEKLNESYRLLEDRVKDRTRHLEEINLALQVEIRQRKELEEKLREQTVKLRQSDRAKDEFLAIFAHELRNPLSPMVMSLELMDLKPIDDPELRESLDIMRRQTGYITRIVNELLDISRVSLGKIELKKSDSDIRELVEDAVATALPSIQGKAQIVSVRLPQEPVVVDVDTLRVNQILTNLISNASKFTELGGTISVSVQTRDGHAVVSVADTGIGIREEDKVRIFEAFYQGPMASSGTKAGLGIGLTLSKQLAELHGGYITVASDGDGKGSTFSLHLPLK